MTDRITILGGGSWGSTLAAHMVKKGFSVSLWEFSKTQVESMKKDRSLGFLPQLKIPETVLITSDMGEALKGADIVFSVVPSQFIRSTWQGASRHRPAPRLVVNFSKGIEIETSKLPTDIIAEECPALKDRIAAVSGPSHAEEVCREIPTAVVAASSKKEIAEETQKILSTPAFRVYTNPDIFGVEICGALKNIFAIACGVCDGLGLGDNSKAALVTRGLYEMAKLGVPLGADQNTFFGLAGMGDLVVTCFSKHSRNRLMGEKLGQGKNREAALKEMTMVAEGVPTAKSAYQLIQKTKADCPIMTEVYRILYENKNARESLNDLLLRPVPVESRNLAWK